MILERLEKHGLIERAVQKHGTPACRVVVEKPFGRDLASARALNELTAKYLDGDPVEVIARRERSSEAAVRSRLARARQAFRLAFRRYANYSPHRPAEAHHESP